VLFEQYNAEKVKKRYLIPIYFIGIVKKKKIWERLKEFSAWFICKEEISKSAAIINLVVH
jgi:hypothetical protein